MKLISESETYHRFWGCSPFFTIT